MRIAVCLKYVPDPATVEVDPLTGVIDTSRMLTITNPADEAALELALRLHAESDDMASEIVALTVGPAATEMVLRNALSVGVTSVLRVWDDLPVPLEPTAIAMLLAAALRREGLLDIILCGTRSVERGSGQVPALLAESLGWPVVTDITHLEMDDGTVRVQQRLERGAREEFVVPRPAVLALEPGLVRLRHASLTGVMKAKRATIPTRNAADLGLSVNDMRLPAPVIRAVLPPRPRPRTTFMPDSSLPPHERIEQILSAGVAREAGQLLEGPPDAMADAILAFLREKGFLIPSQEQAVGDGHQTMSE